MNQVGYIILTIAIVVVLLVIFFVSFVLYVKTPAPKGCERGHGPNCATCEVESCKFYAAAEEKAAKRAAEAQKLKQQEESDKDSRKEK